MIVSLNNTISLFSDSQAHKWIRKTGPKQIVPRRDPPNAAHADLPREATDHEDWERFPACPTPAHAQEIAPQVGLH